MLIAYCAQLQKNNNVRLYIIFDRFCVIFGHNLQVTHVSSAFNASGFDAFVFVFDKYLIDLIDLGTAGRWCTLATDSMYMDLMYLYLLNIWCIWNISSLIESGTAPAGRWCTLATDWMYRVAKDDDHWPSYVFSAKYVSVQN